VSFALPRATRIAWGRHRPPAAHAELLRVFCRGAHSVALALLAFNTYPIVIALTAWFVEGERPTTRAIIAMPVALAGLTLALDVGGWSGAGAAGFAGRWDEIGVGVLYATGASLSFSAALYLTTRCSRTWTGALRTFLATGTIAVVMLAVGGLTDAFALPVDSTGWIALLLVGLCYSAAVTTLFVVLPRIGVVNNSAALNFEPVAVLAMGWVLRAAHGAATDPRRADRDRRDRRPLDRKALVGGEAEQPGRGLRFWPCTARDRRARRGRPSYGRPRER